MKKVLFVTSTLNTGGVQRIFSDIIMNLPSEYEPEILLNDSDDIRYPYRGIIHDLGMKPRANKNSVWYQLRVFIRRQNKLRKLKKTGEYITCVSGLESANFANAITGNKYCKSILTVHCSYENGWINAIIDNIVKLLMRLSYKKATKVVAVSKGIEQELIEYIGIPQEKVMTICNGYDVERITRQASETNNDLPELNGHPVVINTGRLSKQKGQWHLIKAFRLIHDKIPEARLVILGEGELRKELEGLVRDLELEDCVKMPGFVSNPFAILRESKVFALPSLFEGYPNALAEALICGVPSISTDCKTGPKEILEDNCPNEFGILMEPFDMNDLWDNKNITNQEKKWADKIGELLSDDKTYSDYVGQAHKRVEVLDMKNVIKKWENLIEG